MKQYPSIDGHVVDLPIHAFAKLDGSQIRADWDRKHGFDKFGSRKVLLGPDHKFLGEAENLIRAKYEDAITRRFRDLRFEFATLYFEFWGPNSFAGHHDPDDVHEVTLFDIDLYKKGLQAPREFLGILKGTDIDHAPLLYVGKPNPDFIQSVRESTLEGMPFEGVVCKGPPLKKGFLPLMFKVKSLAWITRVKSLYSDPKTLADLL